MPLLVVVFLSMVKDVFEDYKRHKSDAQENQKQVRVFDRVTRSFVFVAWEAVKVGQLV